MHVMSGLVNQVILALFLTLIMTPVSRRLQKHMSATWANVLIILGVVVTVFVLMAFIILSLGSLVTDLPAYEQRIDQTSAEINQTLGVAGPAGRRFGSKRYPASANACWSSRSPSPQAWSASAQAWYSRCSSSRSCWATPPASAPVCRRRSHPTTLHCSASAARHRQVATYLLLLTIINLVIGVLNAIFLFIIGIPNPVFWGFISFITGYIPFIGFWIAMVPVMIIGLAKSGWMMVLVILLGYWLINGVLSNVVAPKLYGRGLNLSPVVTLISVLFWSFILGPIGGMVAVPLTAILSSVILVSYPETQWIAILMREGEGGE